MMLISVFKLFNRKKPTFNEMLNSEVDRLNNELLYLEEIAQFSRDVKDKKVKDFRAFEKLVTNKYKKYNK